MIKGVVELSDTKIKEVIIPRIDVVFIPADIEEEELYDILMESGHSRFPVYEDTIDNVVGVLYVKDLLSLLVRKKSIVIRELMRKAYFVPESMKLDALLKEFKHRRVHIAIVVDEYGGVSGIVCMEDIIEEIVGDIQDEFDNEDDDLLEIGDGTYLCDARLNIEDLNEKLNFKLPEEKFDTFGGFVFDLFGKIPVRFEKVSYSNLDFIIQSMDGHKIKTVKIMFRDDAEK
ncbi:HlyC/CorC family transporter [Oceanispirochaeta sp. M2]|nr:HlyC/CorC family transporter [Oceanispirochaeta sp. M2]NPD71515.1 HlyC/CorC family transporter [Oceanispirochaeta sp. M1]RDG33220.1 HlyC/CorC family transporter [Oceanispirochaeta sp. M1]